MKAIKGKMLVVFSILLSSQLPLHSLAYASGDLPSSAISVGSLPVYGAYMTTDPTCQTGLIAIAALSATPQTINFASGNPTIGAGAVPATIGCFVLVIKNTFSSTWLPGTYTTSSTHGSDSVCNAGGSSTNNICASYSVSFPSQITSDAAKVGLTLASSCPASPTGSEIIPLYISTYAACLGTNTDTTSGCVVSNNTQMDPFSPPTAAGDTAHGIKLSGTVNPNQTIYIAVNPANIIGNAGNSACGNISAPAFSIHN